MHPEWKTGLQAADIFESGKRADAKVSTHSVLQPVASAEQAAEAFDSITYNKGAAVITMLEAYVGAEAFRDGVRRYMRAHAFGNTIDNDLWREIQAVAGKPVLEIEHEFTRQVGVPLVRVERAGQAYRLVEARFAEDPMSLKGAPKTTWHLPLAVASAGEPPTTIILTQVMTVHGRAPLVNAGATAYARVAYPAADAAALADRIARLTPMDQLNLMNDAWALGQSGYAPARNLMSFIAKLPADAEPLVWNRAVRLLVMVDEAYGTDAGRSAFRSRALQLLEPVARRIGTVAEAGENPNVQSLRARIWAAQVRFGDSEALGRAKMMFTSGKGSVSDQRAALDIVGQAADQGVFETLLARARAVQDPQKKLRILRAMARATDPNLSALMVDIALGPDAPAGSCGELLDIAGNENPDAVWRALEPHLAKGPLPIDEMQRWVVVTYIAAGSADPGRVAEVRRYGEQDMPPDARRPVEAAVASIKLNGTVKTTALPDIDRWIAGRAQ
jgi:aminopeptidase N